MKILSWIKGVSPKPNDKCSYKKGTEGTALVVQRLRTCLSMKGTRVWYLVWEDPICHIETKTMSHNYPSPCTQGPELLKRSHSNEKLETRESPRAEVKTQNRQKLINKIILKKRKKPTQETEDGKWCEDGGRNVAKSQRMLEVSRNWKRKVTESHPEPLEEAMQERKRCWFNNWVGKIPWWRAWQPTPVFLPGKFHGQRSLAGYSPQGHKLSVMTERACT